MAMKNHFYDIRIRPDEKEHFPCCDWVGCSLPAPYHAPKGREREGEYYAFCLDHIRRYNKAYNYFSNMAHEEIATFHEQSLTGHRPTWSFRSNSRSYTASGSKNRLWSQGFHFDGILKDSFHIFREGSANVTPPDKPIHKAACKALYVLGLTAGATAEAICARYRQLLKRHHPDTNGGSRDGENKLMAIIQAYNELKIAGIC